jgi:hypothetical protein
MRSLGSVWINANALDPYQIFGHSVHFFSQLMGEPAVAETFAK